VPQFDEPVEFNGAIIYCPVCCTNIDATEDGEQSFECNNCETKFTVVIDKEKVAVHAMNG